MTVKEALASIKDKINSKPSMIESVNNVYQFNLSGEESGIYQIIFSDGAVDYMMEERYEPDCKLILSERSFLKLLEGTLNPTVAYMSGKLKIEGSLGLALKLQSILKGYQ